VFRTWIKKLFGSSRKGICSSTDNLNDFCARIFSVVEISTSEKDCENFDGNWCCYGTAQPVSVLRSFVGEDDIESLTEN
jgi:hypothetical protein